MHLSIQCGRVYLTQCFVIIIKNRSKYMPSSMDHKSKINFYVQNKNTSKTKIRKNEIYLIYCQIFIY